ncbi:alanyl-tRNA synthetase [Clostridium pascui]|uniref:DHHA1 domain-containing protein n=1 Tax=Clostridium pascui TaxID=46609 RepID=UPI001FAF4957|nr:DHHA1 domain-containing protein [Clostridium pascui]MBM7869972.1 alanyl-tRNA synthetase [Clostridium pascui]
MEKLYYENPYMNEFTAEILNIVEKDNKYHVELDKTYFYPGSENMPCDTGEISSIPVIYVYENDEKVYHVLETKPIKIHKVKCTINWSKKYNYMQHNIGKVLLSHYFLELFNANTVKFHYEDNYTYIDIDKVISFDEIKRVEEIANKIVFNNISIESFYATKSELKKLSVKKVSPKGNEKIRVVKIEDIIIAPYTQLLTNSTIEAQVIKIVKWEPLGKNTRIEFLCGLRAVSDYVLKHEYIKSMFNLLKCDNEKDALAKVQNLRNELNDALSEKGVLKAQVAEYEVKEILNNSENINGVKIIKNIFDNGDLKYINLLASKLVSYPKAIVLFAIKTEDKAQLVFMCSKDLKVISMNLLLKDAITLIDGKGGGSDFSAQGGGKDNNNLISCIEYAYKKVCTYFQD